VHVDHETLMKGDDTILQIVEMFFRFCFPDHFLRLYDTSRGRFNELQRIQVPMLYNILMGGWKGSGQEMLASTYHYGFGPQLFTVFSFSSSNKQNKLYKKIEQLTR